jgi:hypothetical protein
MQTLKNMYEAVPLGNAEYKKDRKNAIKEMDKRAKKGMDFLVNAIWSKIKGYDIMMHMFKNKEDVSKHLTSTGHPLSIQSKEFEAFEPHVSFKDAMKLLDKAEKLADVSDIDDLLVSEPEELFAQGYNLEDFVNYSS